MTNYVRGLTAICLLLAVVSLLTIVAPPSFAGIPTSSPLANTAGANANPTVLPPFSVPYGKTYAEWSVLWWQRFLPLTAAQFNTCTIGQSDHQVAFLLAGPPGCAGTVLPGTALFLPIANVECSNLETPPFYGATALDRDTCAKAFFNDLAKGGILAVEVDGIALQNLSSYATISPDFAFAVGPDNVFGMPCGSASCTGRATGYGYYLMLVPLQPGRHIIHIVATSYGIDTLWTLTVRQ